MKEVTIGQIDDATRSLLTTSVRVISNKLDSMPKEDLVVLVKALSGVLSAGEFVGGDTPSILKEEHHVLIEQVGILTENLLAYSLTNQGENYV